ncbi:MAG TPA: hypothetical protein VFZ66_24755 [Herpetosiphonaceae bacterium]
MSALWVAVNAEGRALWRWLREPWLWLLVAAMLALGWLAYQTPFAYALDIGGSPPVAANCAASAVYDLPYIEGFNLPDSEYDVPRAQCQSATVAYRWAFEHARIRLPGLGSAPLSADLRIVALPPATATPTSTWSLGGRPLLTIPLTRPSATYHVLLPVQPSGDLDLRLHSTVIQPPGDPRQLAFAADGLSVAALGSTAPDWSQLGMLCAIVGVGYGLLRRWTLPARYAAPCAGIAILALAALLIWQRIGLSSSTALIVRMLLAGYGLSMLFEPLAAGLAHRIGISASPLEARAITALIVVAWLVRAIGLLHPQTFSSDIGLNANNLLGVTRGIVVFTEDLPGEAGGGPAPYPPGQYIALLPLQLLTDDRDTLLTLANALVDSLAMLWLWLILRYTDQPPVAAYFAGISYIFAIPLLRSLSVGEMANVWGQAMVLPWALALLLWRRGRVSDLALGAATAIVLLGHFGVLLSMLAFGAALVVVWLLQRDPRLRRLVAIGAAALVGAALIYYTAPELVAAVRDRPSAPPASTTVAQRIGGEVSKLLQPNSTIGPLLALLGIGGLIVAWRRCRALGGLLAAWWLAMLLSWATLLISQQALRWESFIFPAIALGSGLALAELWCRRAIFRLGAIAAAALMLGWGGVWWIDRLLSYR